LQHARIVTTDAVLTEVVNTFSTVAWRPVAISVMGALEDSIQTGDAEVIHVDRALWQRGWQLFCGRSDKGWSLTDCISFIVMRDRNLTRVFTSDHHFRQAGFEALIDR